MKNMKTVVVVSVAFVAGLECGIALMTYGILWAKESIKQDLKNYKPDYKSFRNKYDEKY